jgi:hypothetical protein
LKAWGPQQIAVNLPRKFRVIEQAAYHVHTLFSGTPRPLIPLVIHHRANGIARKLVGRAWRQQLGCVRGCRIKPVGVTVAAPESAAFGRGLTRVNGGTSKSNQLMRHKILKLPGIFVWSK